MTQPPDYHVRCPGMAPVPHRNRAGRECAKLGSSRILLPTEVAHLVTVNERHGDDLVHDAK